MVYGSLCLSLLLLLPLLLLRLMRWWWRRWWEVEKKGSEGFVSEILLLWGAGAATDDTGHSC